MVWQASIFQAGHELCAGGRRGDGGGHCRKLRYAGCVILLLRQAIDHGIRKRLGQDVPLLRRHAKAFLFRCDAFQQNGQALHIASLHFACQDAQRG